MDSGRGGRYGHRIVVDLNYGLVKLTARDTEDHFVATVQGLLLKRGGHGRRTPAVAVWIHVRHGGNGSC